MVSQVSFSVQCLQSPSGHEPSVYQPTGTIPLALIFCPVTGSLLHFFLLNKSAAYPRGDDQFTLAFETALLPLRYAKPAKAPLFA
ncbi:hypothetical protein BDI_0899 [Parabacteroides distasonis ATCC 8503]|uniref:Uncharacterized protein n=1 Tax=Parabacteroides distasonis (strain ATCC 8503 / DSM 20701 / CIP 104284 / JCM 5825 / NCTC 11152) TaxID=435591 RepID=A6LAF3_PARD8|nr:hypothetical protein BDI_0899 [Parabacteroides distasonis ATCC 8503]